jgi:hypothetical protein
MCAAVIAAGSTTAARRCGAEGDVEVRRGYVPHQNCEMKSSKRRERGGRASDWFAAQALHIDFNQTKVRMGPGILWVQVFDRCIADSWGNCKSLV